MPLLAGETRSLTPPARLVRRAQQSGASGRGLRQLHEWALQTLWAGEQSASGSVRPYRVALERHFELTLALESAEEAAAHVEACVASGAVAACEEEATALRREIQELTDALCALYCEEELAATGVIHQHSTAWYRGFLGLGVGEGCQAPRLTADTLAGTRLGRDVGVVAARARACEEHLEAGRRLVGALSERNETARRVLDAQHTACALLASRTAFDTAELHDPGRGEALEEAACALGALEAHGGLSHTLDALESTLGHAGTMLGEPYPSEERRRSERRVS